MVGVKTRGHIRDGSFRRPFTSDLSFVIGHLSLTILGGASVDLSPNRRPSLFFNDH